MRARAGRCGPGRAGHRTARSRPRPPVYGLGSVRGPARGPPGRKGSVCTVGSAFTGSTPLAARGAHPLAPPPARGSSQRRIGRRVPASAGREGERVTLGLRSVRPSPPRGGGDAAPRPPFGEPGTRGVAAGAVSHARFTCGDPPRGSARSPWHGRYLPAPEEIDAGRMARPREGGDKFLAPPLPILSRCRPRGGAAARRVPDRRRRPG